VRFRPSAPISGLGLIAALFFLASPVFPQANSNAAGVNLTARLDNRLTVVASPGLVNFVLLPSGISNGSTPVTVRTIWQLPQLIGIVTTYAYFSSAPAALTNGTGGQIPSSRVFASNNGGPYQAFTANSPFAAGSSIMVRRTFIIFFNRSGSTTNTLNLRIDTTGLGLSPGFYSGVMNVQAVAI
jgi:hypothetical protein